MGIVIVSEIKGFLCAVDRGNASKIGAYPVFVLIFGEYLFYFDGDDLTVFIPESEAYGRDLAVGVSTGNHLDGYINANNTFHKDRPPFSKVSDSIVTSRTCVCKWKFMLMT